MKRILVVDDNDDILYVVQVILKDAGYDVLALSHITKEIFEDMHHFPDLVLLDMMLAGADGRDICRLLKSHPDYRTIPIILFSASDITKEDAMTCGADDFISKPFDMDDLLAKIEKLLDPQPV